MSRPVQSLCFSFEGTFRVEDAVRAAGQLVGAAPGTTVRLDFSHCDQVEAGGVARLVDRVTSVGGVLQLTGLTRHDVRILRYLLGAGVDLPAAPLDTD